MEERRCGDGWKAVASMLMVQLIATGMLLLARVVLIEGTFVFALLTYRQVIGAVCVAPFAFLFERDGMKGLSWSAGSWLFISALTGVTMGTGFYYYGLRDTTATYATSFLNLVPIATFVLSAVVGLEKLRLGTKAGKAKTIGTVVCVAGALTMTLYRGKSFYLRHDIHHHQINAKNFKFNWPRGIGFLVGGCLSYAMWFIVQAKLLRVYPHQLWATMLTCIIGSAQATALGLCLDRTEASWKLAWNLQLVTVIYSGVLATAATICMICWVVAKRGPTYPPMFNPLSLIFVAIAEALFLGEPITVGSLGGTSLVVVGLYLFLWGKSKESKITSLPKKMMTRTGVAIEVSAGVPESMSKQSTAMVTPVVCPANDDISHVDDHDHDDRKQRFGVEV